MAISYPTNLDNFTNNTDSVDDVVAQDVNDLNDAVEALEAKVGIDSSAVTTSHDYKLSSVTGTDKAASKTGTETLTNKTLTSPVFNTSVSGTAVLDEDNMASDSATKVATQQSIKAYVDSGTVTMTNKTLTAPVLNGTLSGTGLTSTPLTTPKITTSINDSNGNEVIKTPATASAINEITVTNAATGNAPVISATGGDTNIDLKLSGKGSGKVYAPGMVVAKGQAKCTSNTAVSLGSYTDITGATVDVTVPTGYTANVIITVVSDVSMDTAGNIFNLGINIGGSLQNGTTISQVSTIGYRNTTATTCSASLSAGTTTIKLQGARASGAGTGTWQSDNTKFTYIVILD